MDDNAQAFGKDVADFVQESLEKDPAGAFRELIEGKDSLKNLRDEIKSHNIANPDEPVNTRLVALQVIRGAFNDVASEDLSLDVKYEPGSQQ